MDWRVLCSYDGIVQSLNVQHSIYESKVTPGTYFDSFYFISCSNVHNCNIHNTLHTIYQLHTNQLHTNQDAESVSILHTQATK